MSGNNFPKFNHFSCFPWPQMTWYTPVDHQESYQSCVSIKCHLNTKTSYLHRWRLWCRPQNALRWISELSRLNFLKIVVCLLPTLFKTFALKIMTRSHVNLRQGIFIIQSLEGWYAIPMLLQPHKCGGSQWLTNYNFTLDDYQRNNFRSILASFFPTRSIQLGLPKINLRWNTQLYNTVIWPDNEP